ncbi:hypothetical protein AVEN_264968-1 [Araneus ventricosus]|uniref:Dehydrogenase/reductase SDR family member 6 n=1 Tax=Araneus ventricosus TaxID=182803 RepID=A0A4Y2TWC5_ARAVE|nr:hypothetical protein AVEN_264968-1 [Araneus ventricosus]
MSDSPVAIVTGGAQGIGAAICVELLRKGYRVCIADIQESKAAEFAKEQQPVYGEENVTVIRCDVSNKSDYTVQSGDTHSACPPLWRVTSASTCSVDGGGCVRQGLAFRCIHKHTNRQAYSEFYFSKRKRETLGASPKRGELPQRLEAPISS